MTGANPAPLDLRRLAQNHVASWSEKAPRPVAELRDLRVRLDEDQCRGVAARYAGAPRADGDPRTADRYEILKGHNLRLYRAVTAAGLVVEPWTGTEQPYRNSRELREHVTRTRRLRYFPTSAGHGPPSDDGPHPLRRPSGVRTAGGDELQHNDLFRVVHDLFGHVMFGHGFGPRGELLAARCQMELYPETAHPVVFTELVAQSCWFFFGPHLLTRSGALPRRGDPGYVPWSRRPYPEQKIVSFAGHPLDAFHTMFWFEEEPE